jgi:tetratricopeptide (TPR) repeat protein
LDGLRAAKGKDAAIAAAREWVKQSPTSASARYALVRELSLAGDATGLQALTTSTDAWFARKLAVDAYDLRIAAVYARYLVLTGRTDEAQKVLDKSQAADSGNAHLWVARADLLKARGDTAEALKAARKAAALNPQHPGYALMLNAPQN